MNLEYLYVDGYKGLKKLTIHFGKQISPVAVNFLIGSNGTGKSSVLEAVGLIFTRVMQGEPPGFDFEIRYRMSDGTVVSIKPEQNSEIGKRLLVRTEKHGEIREYASVPTECLPDRIISCCSGANNSMEEILLLSPRNSLASNLYDLAAADGEERDYEFLSTMLEYYKQLDINPRVLSLDSVTAKFILPVLFAVLPLDIQSRRTEEVEEYCSMREELIGRLEMNVSPVVFSFRVKEERLKSAGNLPQMNILRQMLREEGIRDLALDRISAGEMDEKGNPVSETTVLFHYRQYGSGEGKRYYHPGLQRLCGGNPFVLLSTLLEAYKEEVISEVNFGFTNGKTRGLYGIEALSDGELMWLARTGLILMAQRDCGKDVLFLLDEPDVHFNDEWNRDFIRILYQLCAGVEHEFLIATHSTLILTDAMHGQVTLLDKGQNGETEERQIHISTFAAQRDEISRQIFRAGAIGEYAEDTVSRMMQENDPEKLLSYISTVGPGYQRFRLYGRYYSLIDEVRQ